MNTDQAIDWLRNLVTTVCFILGVVRIIFYFCTGK
jgi:hypothetical protein